MPTPIHNASCKNIKAITLISGGLDSILAAEVIKEQGIDIIPLNFEIPFCHRVKKNSSQSKNRLVLVAGKLGKELKVIDVSEDFLKLLKNPRYGFGANMNPCIDCKILMLTKAKELMKEWDAAFVVTGEVLGQRPMSQHKEALLNIAKRAGLEGLVLRPLSAKVLPETTPEKEGWVRRDKLLDFSGRGRRRQIELAQELGIKEYSQPAGGCLLTDMEFSKRLKDIISHQELNIDNVELLKFGRHFRISGKAKLVVGREEKENEQLINLAKENDYLFSPDNELAGPTSLGRGVFNEELVRLSCRITSSYCDHNGKINKRIIYRMLPDKEERTLEVSPIEKTQLLSIRI
ncbi:MAG: tRNA 4-thiouridine(8) synthase ThiI [Candidatus Omnitrophica bacterium]|nr:tRNA 4-thiouridine(8) synthase ThiI [Candidatus Omnitrophota bacterium]